MSARAQRGWCSALLAALLLSVIPCRAVAQDDAPSADAAEAEAEPAPTPAESEAMERFADAQALFERGDHRGALAEMQRVYELLEGSPNQYVVLYNLGRVYEELHRYDLAVDTYQRFLDTAPEDASDRSDAEASLRALERLLGTVAISVNVDQAEVWIGDWQVGVAPGEIRVPSGVSVLEVRASGYETARMQLDVTARSHVDITITLAQLSDFHGLDPSIFITTTVLAAAAGIAGGVLGGMALSLHDDAEACRTRVGCVIDVAGRRQSISDFALAADVMYGTAGLFAVTSVVLAFLTDWGGHPAASDQPTTATALRLMPSVTGSASGPSLGLDLSGAF
jgi:tetratricopeptide (TPR) repeat protein